MTDDPIASRLRQLRADAADPDPRFLDRLHDELATELGLATRRTADRGLSSVAAAPTDIRRGSRRVGWSTRALLAAAVLAAGAIGAAGIGARLLDPAPDLLAVVRDAGVLRIQVGDQGGVEVGAFNAELARRLGERIGIPVTVEAAVDPAGLDGPEGWDLAIPGPTTVLDTRVYARSAAAYVWPVHVESGSATRLSELAGQTICAVDGTAGAVWVADPGGIKSETAVVDPPAGAILVLQPTQGDCDQGIGRRWAGLVTAGRGPQPNPVGRLRSIDDTEDAGSAGHVAGPVFSVGVPVVASLQGPDPTALLALVNAALDGLQGDGSLEALSLEALGADVSHVPDAVRPDRTAEPEPTHAPSSPAPAARAIRIWVVAPAADGGGQEIGAFTTGLTRLLAARLGEPVEVTTAPGNAFLHNGLAAWDLALPGPDWLRDDRYVASATAYFWPVHVVTGKLPGAEPAIHDLADLAGHGVCAVAGSPGGQWLSRDAALDSITPVAGIPPTVAVSLESGPAVCRDGLGTRWDALVTTTTLASPFVGYDAWTVGGTPDLGGYAAPPVLTSAVAFVTHADDPAGAALLQRVDAALDTLRADGSLHALSLETLGGRDLVTPPGS